MRTHEDRTTANGPRDDKRVADDDDDEREPSHRERERELLEKWTPRSEIGRRALWRALDKRP
jgi:hypothetical protein